MGFLLLIAFNLTVQDDPEAHNKFVRISKAYEILKDEEMRKKYDTHGEDGLNDDKNRGQRYESWQWYQQNFGKI